MRLIELSANKATFKTVRFNRTGLTLILGKHKTAKKADLKKTYNGVGKSLIIALVNYCLGSNRNKVFDTHLEGWEFSLTFEIGGSEHTVRRSPGEDTIQFDGEEFNLTKLRAYLQNSRVFEMPGEKIDFLTFKSLLAFFLRPSRASYTSHAKPQPKWTDYQSVLMQSYLLGLDYHLAVQKHDKKKQLDERTVLADRYKKDTELRQFYLGEKNAEVELKELDLEITRLKSDLEAFAVAENYGQRQQHADELHHAIAARNNERIVLENLLRDLDLALTVKPDVAPEQVVSIFEEASVHLPDLIVRRLSDVQEFYRNLHDNRRKRIEVERRETAGRIEEIKIELLRVKKELDAELQFLNAHRALDEYAENNRYLAEVITRRNKIQDYQTLLTQYTEEAQEIRVEFAVATVEAGKQLHKNRRHLDLLMETFSAYSHELYGNVPAGLVVRNNDGENQIRYHIEPRIENDAADGINEGKIFCFDMLLLTLQQRHNVNFLFHDNRLFADMDRFQRLSLFRLADRLCTENGYQYIATANEDVIDSVVDIAGKDFQRLFQDSVVLELDDSPGGTGKLLGIQIDIHYDSD